MKKLFFVLSIILFAANGYCQNVLWGVVSAGGEYDLGTIAHYSPATDSWITDYSFETPFPGGVPLYNELIEVNGKIYGMVWGGGSSYGILFEWDPATDTYTRKVAFDPQKGYEPRGSLTYYNGKLYGMTARGGTSEGGVIFEWDPATNVYTKRRDLDFSTATFPQGSLTLHNGKFYGTGNSSFSGNEIFEWDPNTNIYTRKVVLPNGMVIQGGALTSANGKLYGMTVSGGAYGKGTLFEFDPATNTHVTKIDLMTETGSNPQGGALTWYNGRFYGVAATGGLEDAGVIFEWDPVSNIYVKRFDFTSFNGRNPHGTLSISQGKLYGTTSSGGERGWGVIFEWDPLTDAYTKRANLAFNTGNSPSASVIVSNGQLYGLTRGGKNGAGCIIRVDISTNQFTELVSFNYAPNGSMPTGQLAYENGKFYGMTAQGGAHGYGVIFEWDPIGKVLTKKVDFDFQKGRSPYGSLVSHNGKFYGVTSGGQGAAGVLFEWDPVTNIYTNKVTADGAVFGGITLYNDKFYGLTQHGGANGAGSLFEWDVSSNTYAVKVHFAEPTGKYPYGSLTLHENKLYGVTNVGGLNGAGVIFEWDIPSNTYTKKYDFNYPTGAYSRTNLVFFNGRFYGTAGGGANGGAGVLFEWDPYSNVYSKMYDFDYTNGGSPALLTLSEDKLYGLANYGGANQKGVVFEWDILNHQFTKKIDLSSVTGNRPYLTQFLPLATLVEQTISFGPLEQKDYGDESFLLESAVSSGLTPTFTSSDPSVATIEGNTVTIRGAGTAVITASQLGNADYHAAIPVTQNLVVSKASLAAKADDQTKGFGEPNPELTITYQGFVGDDDQWDLDNRPLASTAAEETSGLGTYAIVLSGGSDASYEITIENGTLTITKADQNILVEPVGPKILGDAAFVINATVSSGLPLSFTSSDSEVASVDGNTVTIRGAGQTLIEISQEGNEFFNAVSVSVPITVYALPSPEALPASGRSLTGFTAHWHSVAGSTGYVVDVSADNFTTTVPEYTALEIPGTELSVMGLQPETTYSYRIRAVNATGLSAYSGAVKTSTLAQPGMQLWGLTASGGDEGRGIIFHYTLASDAIKTDHSFNSVVDGSYPALATLAALNGKLYGVTSQGGSEDAGVIFEYDPASNQYTRKVSLIYAEGAGPMGTLRYANGIFYGVTQGGGANSYGVLFQWDPVNNIYTKLVDFGGEKGIFPTGSLSMYGGKFYGMTQQGGAHGYGVVFEWDPVSHEFAVKQHLHYSTGGFPNGTLTYAGGKFYGVAGGGPNHSGLIFEWNPVNNNYTQMVDFSTLGGSPGEVSLSFLKGKFYGLTSGGGTNGAGSIFEWDPSLNTTISLVNFTVADGSYPVNEMIYRDGKFYGLAMTGGIDNAGVIFDWDPNSNTYNKRIDLSAAEGSFPSGSLTYFGGKFYGLTSRGGQADDGVLFAWDPLSNTYEKKIELGVNTGIVPNGSLTYYNGKYYGMTSAGGAFDAGVIFEWDPETRLYSSKIDFDVTTRGAAPHGHLTMYNGKFYGITTKGGSQNGGVIFEWDPTLNLFTKKLDVNYSCYGSLTLKDGKFYGITGNTKPAKGSTTVFFEWDPLTNAIVNHNFSHLYAKGSLAELNGKFYGMSEWSSLNRAGTIFEWDPSVLELNIKVSFDGSNGASPTGSLTYMDGKFYGVTSTGGAEDRGVLFAWDPVTNEYVKKHDFTSASGTDPHGSLTAVEGKLYGLTQTGGLNDAGIFFAWDIMTDSFIKKEDLSNITGAHPYLTTLTAVMGTLGQKITFDPLPSKETGDAPFELSASSTSGLTITYTIADPSIATIDEHNIVTLYKAGTTTITASQPGNDSYEDATPVTRVLTVTEKPLYTLTFGPLPEKVYGDEPFTLEAETNSDIAISYSSSDASVASVSDDLLTIHGAGTVMITATLDPGSGDEVLNATQALVVAKATLGAVADDKTRAYGETNAPLTITYSGFIGSDDALVLDVAPMASTDVNESTLPGSYPILLSEGADNNYEISVTDGVFTITGEVPDVYVMNPVDGSIDQNVFIEMTVKTVSGANTYTIELNTSPDFNGDAIVQSGGPKQKFSDLAYGMQYYARVRTDLSLLWGPPTSFSTASPEHFAYVISPADGDTDQKISLKVDVNPVLQATQYEIELNTSSDFTGSSVVGVGPSSQSFSGLFYGTLYYARVRTDLSQAWGKITTFKTSDASRLAQVKSPSDGATDVSTTVTVTIVPMKGASQYLVELNTSPDFSATAFVQSGTKKFNFSGLQNNTTYYTRVQSNVFPGWGPVTSFTTTGAAARMSASGTSEEAEFSGDGETGLSVSAHPNPFVHAIHVQVSGSSEEEAEIQLKDISGRIVYQSIVPTNTVNSIDASLVQGFYFLTVKSGRHYKVVKVVKQ